MVEVHKTCPCGWSGRPTQTFNLPGGLTDTCGKCGSYLAAAMPSAVFVDSTPSVAATPSSTIVGDPDIISLIRARLLTLEAEIAILETKRTEVQKLKRMLAAVDQTN